MTQSMVSILVPVYGVEKYIERCAVSLMEQTYEDIEYIFVDDASPDLSVAVLEEVVARYAKRKSMVRVLHHAQNRGLSAARNTAVDAAVGKYMLHVDSDDYLATDAIEKLVRAAENEQAKQILSSLIPSNCARVGKFACEQSTENACRTSRDYCSTPIAVRIGISSIVRTSTRGQASKV